MSIYDRCPAAQKHLRSPLWQDGHLPLRTSQSLLWGFETGLLASNQEKQAPRLGSGQPFPKRIPAQQKAGRQAGQKGADQQRIQTTLPTLCPGTSCKLARLPSHSVPQTMLAKGWPHSSADRRGQRSLLGGGPTAAQSPLLLSGRGEAGPGSPWLNREGQGGHC